MACWVATSAELQAASMESAGPPRSKVCATTAEAMLIRFPAIEKARIGTTFSTSASRSASCPGNERPKAPLNICMARMRERSSSLCSLALAPMNTPVRERW